MGHGFFTGHAKARVEGSPGAIRSRDGQLIESRQLRIEPGPRPSGGPSTALRLGDGTLQRLGHLYFALTSGSPWDEGNHGWQDVLPAPELTEWRASHSPPRATALAGALDARSGSVPGGGRRASPRLPRLAWPRDSAQLDEPNRTFLLCWGPAISTLL